MDWAQQTSGTSFRVGAARRGPIPAVVPPCPQPGLDLAWLGACRADVRLICPALIVWGTKEWALGDDGWKRIQADLPHARVELLEAGHFVMEEQPENVAQKLLDFFHNVETAH